MSAQTLLFLHIPKAGGSTLRSLLHQQYAPEECYKIEEDINGDINRLFALSTLERSKIKLVTGHMAFGAHTLFEDAKYVTFMRSPVDRVISEYRFIYNNVYHALHQQVAKLDLMGYLDSGISSQISNGQTRLIAGVCQPDNSGILSKREVTKDDYERAIENLQNYFVLPSSIEFYDQTLVLWAKYFGWPPPFYMKKNITSGLKVPATAAEIQRIEDLNQWDLQLYWWTQQRMQRLLDSQKLNFRGQVSIFKVLNWLHGKRHGLKYRIQALQNK